MRNIFVFLAKSSSHHFPLLNAYAPEIRFCSSSLNISNSIYLYFQDFCSSSMEETVKNLNASYEMNGSLRDGDSSQIMLVFEFLVVFSHGSSRSSKIST